MSEITLRIPCPNPRQAEFLRCRKKYIAFGGARGGGGGVRRRDERAPG